MAQILVARQTISWPPVTKPHRQALTPTVGGGRRAPLVPWCTSGARSLLVASAIFHRPWLHGRTARSSCATSRRRQVCREPSCSAIPIDRDSGPSQQSPIRILKSDVRMSAEVMPHAIGAIPVIRLLHRLKEPDAILSAPVFFRRHSCQHPIVQPNVGEYLAREAKPRGVFTMVRTASGHGRYRGRRIVWPGRGLRSRPLMSAAIPPQSHLRHGCARSNLPSSDRRRRATRRGQQWLHM